MLSEVPDQMQRVIAELECRLDTRPLSGAQRQAYAETANQFLATIAKDRQSYGFYELARWEKELAEVANRLPDETRLALLGGLGTTASQQELVSMASEHFDGCADSAAGGGVVCSFHWFAWIAAWSSWSSASLQRLQFARSDRFRHGVCAGQGVGCDRVEKEEIE